VEKTLLENPYIVPANLKRKLEFDARETVGEKPFRFAKCVITYSRVARNLATTDLSGEKFTGKEGRKEGRTTVALSFGFGSPNGKTLFLLRRNYSTDVSPVEARSCMELHGRE